MRKKLILSTFALIGIMLVSHNKVIFAANGATDTGVLSLALEPKLPNEKTIAPNVTISNAGHVANGIALADKTSGWISLRGVPNGSTIVRAFLYWNFSDTNATGFGGSAVVFNGNRVNGFKRADNSDTCWQFIGNHTYRANVTPFIPANNPNIDYKVVINFNGTTTTKGRDPMSTDDIGSRMLKGATLIAVYSDESTTGKQVRIYDALSDSKFDHTGTFTFTHPALSGSGLFTMCGADGQRGGYLKAHENEFNLSNEKTTFNGTQIAGPPLVTSDWDGSTGLPLPQLWDVHTHPVTLSGTSSVVIYTSPDTDIRVTADCLIPVAFVLEK
ncbi:MAG: DUF3344 domain-containing protein [Candidatus Jettenia sp.]|nr:MAG: DUF3344 domain-containing protein [Candidatus Jettenia sp.]